MRAGKSTKAISSVIAMIMLLAVISTAVSIISVNLLPVMEKKAEIEHNRKLKDEFLDIVKIYSDSAENRGFSLTLGKSKTLFGQSTSSSLSVRRSGSVEISLLCNQTHIEKNYTLFRLDLSTHNSLLPDQTIVFSEGGIIERQSDIAIERLSPDIRIELNNTNNTLLLTIDNLTSSPTEVSGNGVAFLTLKKRLCLAKYINCTGSIRISDEVFGGRWEEKIRELFGSSPVDGTISINAPINISLKVRNFEIFIS